MTFKPSITTPKKITGRPSSFTQEIADEICERLSNGEPLAVICRDDHMPAVRTVYDWINANEDLSASIAGARARGFDKIAADCLEIADDGSNDYVVKKRPDGEDYDAFDAEHVQRSKLRIDTRLKLLAKWDPKRYGEKAEVKHSGDVGVTLVMLPGDDAL